MPITAGQEHVSFCRASNSLPANRKQVLGAAQSVHHNLHTIAILLMFPDPKSTIAFEIEEFDKENSTEEKSLKGASSSLYT